MTIKFQKSARLKLTVFLLLFHLLLSASASARSEINGRVVKVADGDTITVLTPGYQQVKVRLYGIDCPERKQAFGQRARQFTAQRIAGENVRVEIMDHDRYGRTVGVVYAENGQNVNRELLSAGMAWVYTQFCKASFCGEWERIEQNARRAGMGLWVERNPVPHGNGGRRASDDNFAAAFEDTGIWKEWSSGHQADGLFNFAITFMAHISMADLASLLSLIFPALDKASGKLSFPQLALWSAEKSCGRSRKAKKHMWPRAAQRGPKKSRIKSRRLTPILMKSG